ncbi:hypothetical protein GOODEAATRI_031477 [Goodea atripinnis]|uniref:Uncharacterized protein n=1 Tax=Goodea atripinnis TaxID=208336 RepID=A0ABV0PIP8_9TELE
MQLVTDRKLGGQREEDMQQRSTGPELKPVMGALRTVPCACGLCALPLHHGCAPVVEFLTCPCGSLAYLVVKLFVLQCQMCRKTVYLHKSLFISGYPHRDALMALELQLMIILLID